MSGILKKRLRRVLEGRGPTPSADPAPDETSGPTDVDPSSLPEDRKERIAALRRQIAHITGRRRPRETARHDEPYEEPAAAPARIDPVTGRPWEDPTSPVPGGPVRGPHGEVWIRDRDWPPGERHGAVTVSSALGLDGEAARVLSLDDAMDTFDLRAATFLDTETTGLSMGTGTVAFLVGIGWFEDETFQVRQLFVDQLENEPAVLAALLESLGERPALVTFNGKTFDVPVLRARLALSRMPTDIGEHMHLDLLHAARRLYKRRVGDCSLDSLERSVLDFHREGDIPGEFIPAVYLEYLRTGKPYHLSDVFHHNLLDVVSMAALLGRMVDLVTAAPDEPEEDMDDLVSLARVRLRRGDLDDAMGILDQATVSGCMEHRVESRIQLAVLARRRGERDIERRLLEEVLDDDPDHGAAHLMLSKLFEHHERDPARALEHARHTAESEGEEAHGRRIARLERRLEKLTR